MFCLFVARLSHYLQHLASHVVQEGLGRVVQAEVEVAEVLEEPPLVLAPWAVAVANTIFINEQHSIYKLKTRTFLR